MHYSLSKVANVMEFILSPRNIKSLSWGKRKMIIDHKEVDFPCFYKVKGTGIYVRDYIKPQEVYFKSCLHHKLHQESYPNLRAP
jgi:hypothetical protein